MTGRSGDATHETNEVASFSRASRLRWTLITVSYNSAPSLREHWSTTRLPEGVEWVVVDNASTDDSIEVASALGARVIALPVNKGFGYANNIGFHASASDYVAFVNPDVTVRPEDLTRLAHEIEAHPKCLVAPQLLHPDGSLQANGRGNPTIMAKLLHGFRPSLAEGRYRRYARRDEVVSCQWLIGAVVCAARSRLRELGPWDDKFFVYYEDSDLGMRNARSGGSSHVIGDVRWVHGLQWRTRHLDVSAWKLAIPSMLRFYTRYPGLIFSTRFGGAGRQTSPTCGSVAPEFSDAGSRCVPTETAAFSLAKEPEGSR